MKLTPIREKALANLLQDLELYRQAKPGEKTIISDRMVFADPIIWIAYKREAYRNTPNELVTVGDFIRHCQHPGDICEKRFRFLDARLHMQNWSSDLLLEAVVNHPALLTMCEDEEFMKAWQAHEFYQQDGKVAKWQSFT